MANVDVQLSDDELERLRAYAEAHQTTPEAVVVQAVAALLEDHEFSDEIANQQGYRDFVQRGIDSADRGDMEEWDVVKKRLRAYIDDRSAAAE